MKSTARRRNNYQNSRAHRILLPLILATVSGVQGLNNISIEIPEAVAVGTSVELTCKYNLESMEDLYAVKWYKGQNEFYRYLPKELPPKLAFGEFGDKIDKSRSDEHRVVLTNVTPDLDGRYRCEVSNDQPHFLTLMVSSHMHVASLPNGGPTLLVEKQTYQVGDRIKANCTTPPSNPPANVTWMINGNPVNSSFMKRIVIKDENRTTTQASLEFEVVSFKNGRLKIVCKANVFQLYNGTADVVLDEERPKLASVLGTRDSPHTGAASTAVAHWIYVGTAANLLLSRLR